MINNRDIWKDRREQAEFQEETLMILIQNLNQDQNKDLREQVKFRVEIIMILI